MNFRSVHRVAVAKMLIIMPANVPVANVSAMFEALGVLRKMQTTTLRFAGGMGGRLHSFCRSFRNEHVQRRKRAGFSESPFRRGWWIEQVLRHKRIEECFEEEERNFGAIRRSSGP